MSNQSVLQRFASANPVTDVDADAVLSDQQWQDMLGSIVSDAGGPSKASAPTLPRKGLRLTALVAGAVALAILVPTVTNGPTGASPAAADALYRAASSARSQRALPVPGPGQFLYRRSMERQTSMYVSGNDLDNFLFTETVEVEDWSAEDGSGRTVSQASEITFPSAADEAAWRATGEPRLETGRRDQHDGAGDRYVLDINDVPTDPDELLAAIERREILGGDPADWVTFQIIGELLQLTYRSPEHRAALYEVAANFPGVDYEGEVTDPLGRTGDAVSYEGGGSRHELIFDPETAELLAERIVLLQQEEGLVNDDTWPGTKIAFAGPPGTVVWWEVYEQTAVVDSPDSRP